MVVVGIPAEQGLELGGGLLVAVGVPVYPAPSLSGAHVGARFQLPPPVKGPRGFGPQGVPGDLVGRLVVFFRRVPVAAVRRDVRQAVVSVGQHVVELEGPLEALGGRFHLSPQSSSQPS